MLRLGKKDLMKLAKYMYVGRYCMAHTLVKTFFLIFKLCTYSKIYSGYTLKYILIKLIIT